MEFSGKKMKKYRSDENRRKNLLNTNIEDIKQVLFYKRLTTSLNNTRDRVLMCPVLLFFIMVAVCV